MAEATTSRKSKEHGGLRSLMRCCAGPEEPASRTRARDFTSLSVDSGTLELPEWVDYAGLRRSAATRILQGIENVLAQPDAATTAPVQLAERIRKSLPPRQHWYTVYVSEVDTKSRSKSGLWCSGYAGYVTCKRDVGEKQFLVHVYLF